jgi:hypothetical protein
LTLTGIVVAKKPMPLRMVVQRYEQSFIFGA